MKKIIITLLFMINSVAIYADSFNSKVESIELEANRNKINSVDVTKGGSYIMNNSQIRHTIVDDLPVNKLYKVFLNIRVSDLTQVVELKYEQNGKIIESNAHELKTTGLNSSVIEAKSLSLIKDDSHYPVSGAYTEIKNYMGEEAITGQLAISDFDQKILIAELAKKSFIRVSLTSLDAVTTKIGAWKFQVVVDVKPQTPMNSFSSIDVYGKQVYILVSSSPADAEWFREEGEYAIFYNRPQADS